LTLGCTTTLNSAFVGVVVTSGEVMRTHHTPSPEPLAFVLLLGAGRGSTVQGSDRATTLEPGGSEGRRSNVGLPVSG